MLLLQTERNASHLEGRAKIQQARCTLIITIKKGSLITMKKGSQTSGDDTHVTAADATPASGEGGAELQQGRCAPEGAERQLPGGQCPKAHGGIE